MQGLPSSTDDSDKVAVLIPEAVRERIFPQAHVDLVRQFAQPVMFSDEELGSGDIESQLEGVTVAITGWKSPPIPAASLAPSGSVAFVSHAAGSVKRLGVQAALEAGDVRVSHAAPVIAQAVAEFTITQILAHLRRHRQMDAGLHAGEPWFRIRDGNLGLLLAAQEVGIVGLGYVGRMVLDLLRPFGCRVCVYDPFVSDEQARSLGVELMDLEQLFTRCAVVSLHAANLPATEGMIRREHLMSMSAGSLLVNTARAGLIEPGAMLEVLQQGQIYAAIDTFDIEPLPEDDGMRGLPNVYLSPHCAGHTSDSYLMQGLCAVEEARSYLAGLELKSEIHRDKAAMLA